MKRPKDSPRNFSTDPISREILHPFIFLTDSKKEKNAFQLLQFSLIKHSPPKTLPPSPLGSIYPEEEEEKSKGDAHV